MNSRIILSKSTISTFAHWKRLSIPRISYRYNPRNYPKIRINSLNESTEKVAVMHVVLVIAENVPPNKKELDT